jgi:hypothetical protein
MLKLETLSCSEERVHACCPPLPTALSEFLVVVSLVVLLVVGADWRGSSCSSSQ